MERVSVVGSILVDVWLTVPHLPDRGGDVLADDRRLFVGGGFNIAYALRQWEVPVRHVGWVGSGPFGRLVSEALRRHGVEQALPTVEEADTGFDIVLREPDGERTFVTTPGVESRLTRAALESVDWPANEIIYVSGYDVLYPETGQAVSDWLRNSGQSRRLVFDPGPLVGEISPERLQGILDRTWLLSLNRREAFRLTGLDTPAAACRALADRSQASVILWRAGAQGAYLYEAGGDGQYLPPYRPRQVVDTTGAGDTHTGTFLAAWLHGEAAFQAGWWANVAAALSVETIGPATAPPRQVVKRILPDAGSNGPDKDRP